MMSSHWGRTSFSAILHYCFAHSSHMQLKFMVFVTYLIFLCGNRITFLLLFIIFFTEIKSNYILCMLKIKTMIYVFSPFDFLVIFHFSLLFLWTFIQSHIYFVFMFCFQAGHFHSYLSCLIREFIVECFSLKCFHCVVCLLPKTNS